MQMQTVTKRKKVGPMNKAETDALIALKDLCDRSPFPSAVVDLHGRLVAAPDGETRIVHDEAPVRLRYAVKGRLAVHAERLRVIYVNRAYKSVEPSVFA